MSEPDQLGYIVDCYEMYYLWDLDWIDVLGSILILIDFT